MANIYKIGDKKILYIHIPKTAGRSLGHILEPYFLENESNDILGHPDFNQIKLIKGEQFLYEIDHIFTIVRNPIDWRHSWHNYVKNETPENTGHAFEHNSIKEKTFKESIKWMNEFSKDSFSESFYGGIPSKLFLKGQNEYVIGCPQDLIILKMENIKNDFNDFAKRFELDLKFDVHVGKSTDEDYRNACDNETENIIKKMYSRDFDVFNY